MEQPKYVYLYELDSVRKTDREIIEGQKALYREIVENGNTVALTYNQLVDSRAFFSLFAPPKSAGDADYSAYADCILQLFRMNKIRVSQFQDIRTISQYLQSAIDEEKEFYYSALPVRYTQKRLTALLRRSLSCSDLSELEDYLQGKRTREELRDLFLEVLPDPDDPSEKILRPSGESDEALREILQNLKSLIALILRLSPMTGIYLPPRDPEEYQSLSLHRILSCAFSLSFPEDSLWEKAEEVWKALPEGVKKQDNRSVYNRAVKSASKGHDDPAPFQYAEAVISLCYDYACEISICDTSKRYDVSELLSDNPDRPSFRSDFQKRLADLWDDGRDCEKRFLLEETNAFHPFARMDQIPDLRNAVRLCAYTRKKEERLPAAGEVHRYEYRYVKGRTERKRAVLRAIGAKILTILLCFTIIYFISLLFDWLQSSFEGAVQVHSLAFSVLETFLFLAVSELFSSSLTKWIPWLLSLSEALESLHHLFVDAFHTLLRHRGRQETAPGQDKTEPRAKEDRIEFVCTKELRKYQKMRKEEKELFRGSPEAPFAPLDSEKNLQALLRRQELYGCRYGVLYESPYNTLLVDPVLGKEGTVLPYERILPTGGDGAVIVPRHNGNYVLLRHYRHAMQDTLYEFPRGFHEQGETPEENARRELKEELDASPSGKPVFLGAIAPDSGLTSRRTAVYLTEIDGYRADDPAEGITGTLEVSPAQLEDMVRSRKVLDGYTLGAISLMNPADS